jgi:hypothetical protein
MNLQCFYIQLVTEWHILKVIESVPTTLRLPVLKGLAVVNITNQD